MEKKKVVFLINHFQYSDGVVSALIGLVNELDLNKFDVTIKPLYRYDKRVASQLKEGIKIEKTFGFYFRGFAKIVRKIPIKWLYKWILGSKYDIEIAFQRDVSTMLVGNSCNDKAVHVAWMHGYDLYPNEYVKCDKVVCVSKYCADKAIAEMGARKADITYKYNLIDDSVIKNQSKEDIDLDIFNKEYPIFVSVGRHSPEKGYVRLVKILAELRDEGYKFHLILVGDGPEHINITKSIKDNCMQNMITLTGADSNPHKYTAKSDVFICSSFNEGYSTACTEAAILGVPIITTDVPGGEEIIDDCECGFLTTKDDESLKQAIKKVLDNPQSIEEWKHKMQNSSKKFSLVNRKKAMNNLFDELYNLSDYKENI